jgi:hypothetical protein
MKADAGERRRGVVTARNRAIDHIRRQQLRAEKSKLLARDLEAGPEATVSDLATLPDERLELIFTCCHPALALGAADRLTSPPRRPSSPGPRRVHAQRGPSLQAGEDVNGGPR